MMKSPKHIICTILCFGLFYFSYSQNLVSNPSFEDTVSCPNNSGQINRAVGWNSPTQYGTSDYFNICATSYSLGINNFAGNQVPKTGNAYGGVETFSRNSLAFSEYLQQKLMDSLVAGNNYCVSFYVSLAEVSKYNCNNIGIFFLKDSLYTPTDSNLSFFEPQIKNDFSNSLNNKINWTIVSDSFVATGGEKYIIIGNFDIPTDLDTMYVGGGLENGAYYYIDDVSVEEVLPVNAGNDTAIISADSVQIGNNPTENANYSWQPATGLSDTNAANPMVWVANITTYVVTKTQCSIVTTDTVIVYSSVGINENNSDRDINLYPNPNSGKMMLDYSLQPNDKGEILFYDITGKLVASYVLDNKDNKLAIINEQLNDGFYTYHIVVNNAVVKSEKLIIRK